MNEINIGRVIVSKRKEKGITQEELANHIGVTKASVSKWETHQSYPDVALLPVLASFFNISIDELINYRPQMTKEEIRKLYRRLSDDFATKPFDIVIDECREIIKKYNACFPLLLQMGILITNHIEFFINRDDLLKIIEEVKKLFIRVKEESGDLALAKQALYMEACACLAAGDPQSTLNLLGTDSLEEMLHDPLIASAHQMTGQTQEAKAVLQIAMYKSIVSMFNLFTNYLMFSTDDPAKFDEVLHRALGLADIFNLRKLHPAVLAGLYICGAQGFAFQDKKEKTLEMLEIYTDIVLKDTYSLRLHGDDFFDLIESRLDKLDLGIDPPRNEKLIMKNALDIVQKNPVFSFLAGEKRFENIVENLQRINNNQ